MSSYSRDVNSWRYEREVELFLRSPGHWNSLFLYAFPPAEKRLSPSQEVLCWEQELDGFLWNTLTANHWEWKTVTAMHPDTSVLCYPSKIKGLEIPSSGFIFSAVTTEAEETISCLGKSLRNLCLKSPTPAWHNIMLHPGSRVGGWDLKTAWSQAPKGA